ncbi:hypothetical protein, partial [Neisseria sp.]|uniref:hypothetical protein n=1 Tax=Neisseria sp. TaxID=192066 RepID=UPI0026DB01A6
KYLRENLGDFREFCKGLSLKIFLQRSRPLLFPPVKNGMRPLQNSLRPSEMLDFVIIGLDPIIQHLH